MTLQFHVNLPLETVFNNLTDMQKYVSYHPVITKIDQTDSTTYVVHETLKTGLFLISFTYPVEVEQDYKTKKVTFEAQVMKINHIKMEFHLFEEEGGTHITETITFKTFLPIKRIMERIFSAQHQKLFKNMDHYHTIVDGDRLL